MWWVQAATALAASRLPPRPSHRVEVAAEALRAARPRRIEAAEPDPEAVLASVAAPVEAVPASVAATHRGRRSSAVQEGGLVGAERGGRGRQHRCLKLAVAGAVRGAVARGGG
jgi:hypothetical protein